VKVIVSAPLGHFQRPGNPGEPSTYPVMPPTAAEGIVNAAYWHPGHSVQVKSISVLAPIQYTTETVMQLDHQSGKPWLRTYELLVEPKYLVEFWLECDEGIDSKKRIGQLARRLQQGQHFCQPCMGLSDYPASVTLLAKDDPGPELEKISMGLGRMPHYWSWEPAPKPVRKSFARRTTAMVADRPLERVTGVPIMFNAELMDGRVTIPRYPQRGMNGYAN
jgi:CRISPR-associated Cas5-like protein